ncbi:MAG: thioredoxin TrxC [Gammaproteobacteria bacterium]|nr:thioredoxin TrxC [Gammaproteobacteria bacterium]
MTVKLTCPHCAIANRVPKERLSDNPKCGKCSQPLFNASPVDINPPLFEAMLKHNDTPVLIDYWAPWCGPCQQMAADYALAATDLEPDVRVGKINTEQHPGLGGSANIRGIPTLILYQSGKEVARQSGAQNRVSIVQWVKQALA